MDEGGAEIFQPPPFFVTMRICHTILERVTLNRLYLGILTIGLLLLNTTVVDAADEDQLRKAAQNPVASMISLPFQNNTLFGVGPDDDTANVLNIQPVIPFKLNEDWNLISRTIVPLLYVPDLVSGLPELPAGISGGDTFGMGDINTTLFVSPAKRGMAIWGFGPSLNIPTATDEILGTRKWSAGPSAVILFMPKPWVFGALARQLVSFAGNDDRSDVSQFLIQPFANYNLPGGWYLVSSPVIAANWEAAGGQKWTVPIGGGVGRLLKLSKLPTNTSVQAFYNVEHPTFGPDWAFRFQVQFLFPK